jgi:hypothetical protein
MVVIVLLWFVISAPLSGIGSYFGSKHGVSGLVTSTTTDLLTESEIGTSESGPGEPDP